MGPVISWKWSCESFKYLNTKYILKKRPILLYMPLISEARILQFYDSDWSRTKGVDQVLENAWNPETHLELLCMTENTAT